NRGSGEGGAAGTLGPPSIVQLEQGLEVASNLPRAARASELHRVLPAERAQLAAKLAAELAAPACQILVPAEPGHLHEGQRGFSPLHRRQRGGRRLRKRLPPAPACLDILEQEGARAAASRRHGGGRARSPPPPPRPRAAR